MNHLRLVGHPPGPHSGPPVEIAGRSGWRIRLAFILAESAGWQGFLNNHDVQRDHGLSGFDVAHRVVASFVWNLPFGKGERFAGKASGVKNAIIGGWQANGIYLWQGGFPISIFAADLGGVLDTFGTNRANIVGDIHSGGGTIMPPSPCTGSTRNAAVLDVIVRASASASPYGIVRSPGGNGPKPSRYCGSLERPVIAIVRP